MPCDRASLRLQTGLHHAAHRGGFKRFGNHKIRPAIRCQFQRVIIIQPPAARHGDDFQMRPRFAQLQYGFDAFFVRHNNIHHDQIISVALGGDTLQRAVPVFRLINPMPQSAQNMRQCQSQLRVIIYDQNIFFAAFPFFYCTRQKITAT